MNTIDWYRIKHNLLSIIDISSYGKYFYTISSTITFEEVYGADEDFETYDEALIACLEKLSQIVNKNEGI